MEGNKTSQRVDRIPPESSPYLLENLEKWTEYGITVRAQTEAGEGPESLQMLIRTEEDGTFQNNPMPVSGWFAPLTMASCDPLLMTSQHPKLTASCFV